MIDPTNTEPIAVHQPPLVKVLIVFIVLLVFLSSMLGITYIRNLRAVPVVLEQGSTTEVSESEPAVIQFSGTIVGIVPGSITVAVQAPPEGLAGEMVVRLSSETQVSMVLLYDAETVENNTSKFLEDMASYEKKIQRASSNGKMPSTEGPPEFPLSFSRVTVDSTALELGQGVSVTTVDPVGEVSDVEAIWVEILPVLTEEVIP